MTTATPKLTERHITEQVKGFLESRGWTGFRMQSGTVRGLTRGTFMRLGKKGTPDWIFVRDRECLFVEMKAPGKVPSVAQTNWITWAEIKGIQVLWADGLGCFMERYGRKFSR